MIVPQGHNHEIDVISRTRARGKWVIDNPQIEISSNTASRIGSTYDEEYIKENDEWRINTQNIHHIYREAISLDSF
ncbi:nuclear transport factor 2 family protein [Chloroflexota bacterium]